MKIVSEINPPFKDKDVSANANNTGDVIDSGGAKPSKAPNKALLPDLRPDDSFHDKKCIVIDLDETLVHSSFKVRSPNFFQKLVPNVTTHIVVPKKMMPTKNRHRNLPKSHTKVQKSSEGPSRRHCCPTLCLRPDDSFYEKMHRDWSRRSFEISSAVQSVAIISEIWHLIFCQHLGEAFLMN